MLKPRCCFRNQLVEVRSVLGPFLSSSYWGMFVVWSCVNCAACLIVHACVLIIKFVFLIMDMLIVAVFCLGCNYRYVHCCNYRRMFIIVMWKHTEMLWDHYYILVGYVLKNVCIVVVWCWKAGLMGLFLINILYKKRKKRRRRKSLSLFLMNILHKKRKKRSRRKSHKKKKRIGERWRVKGRRRKRGQPKCVMYYYVIFMLWISIGGVKEIRGEGLIDISLIANLIWICSFVWLV